MNKDHSTAFWQEARLPTPLFFFFFYILHLFFPPSLCACECEVASRCRQGALWLRNSPKASPLLLLSLWDVIGREPSHTHRSAPLDTVRRAYLRSDTCVPPYPYRSPVTGKTQLNILYPLVSRFRLCITKVCVETIHQVLVSSNGFSLSTEGLPVGSYLAYSNTEHLGIMLKCRYFLYLLWLAQLNLNIITLSPLPI